MWQLDISVCSFSIVKLNIARRTLATREESLRLIALRQQGGLATALDVRQTEELVHHASETIPDTERQIAQTENQLSFILFETEQFKASVPLG